MIGTGAAARGSMLAAGIAETGLVGAAGRGGGDVGIAPDADCGADVGGGIGTAGEGAAGTGAGGADAGAVAALFVAAAPVKATSM